MWSESGRTKIVETLQRVQAALNQNPGFRVMYEFPDEVSRQEAIRYFQQVNLSNIVETRVRGQ